MAQPTNTFDQYDSIGNREDLSDVIYDVSPEDTPFISAIGRGSASNVFFEWQTDVLGAVADNKAVEGDAAVNDAVVATVRLGNYNQISDKTVVVSLTQEAINKAGRASEMAYQMGRKSIELKRDMENATIGLNNVRLVGNATTARELGSLHSWVFTNVSNGGGSAAEPTGDGTDTRTDGTQRAITEAILEAQLDSIWTNAGSVDGAIVFTGSHVRRVINAFNGVSSVQNVEVTGKTIVAAVSFYESDFGTVSLVLDRHMRARDAFIIDPSMFALHFLRDFHSQDMPSSGDYVSKTIRVEYTLAAYNEASSALIADLNTS